MPDLHPGFPKPVKPRSHNHYVPGPGTYSLQSTMGKGVCAVIGQAKIEGHCEIIDNRGWCHDTQNWMENGAGNGLLGKLERFPVKMPDYEPGPSTYKVKGTNKGMCPVVYKEPYARKKADFTATRKPVPRLTKPKRKRQYGGVLDPGQICTFGVPFKASCNTVPGPGTYAPLLISARPKKIPSLGPATTLPRKRVVPSVETSPCSYRPRHTATEPHHPRALLYLTS
eukprot:TRINITY_DN31718_c0_g1_i1.p1 TRINITY_DN31718_c0_g1~~TRINITY_DN31718_c0_g1_i1.p1  ORF type:complete len:233 (+),score=24.08 TRINITY_DN31718_c0_g1_i1:24-701(+)